MLDRTRRLWEKQNRLVGDRVGLFRAVADFVGTRAVLYPGSYVDITPSFVWPSVTYIDSDRRANQFFADGDGVQALLRENGVDGDRHAVRFIHCDYTEPSLVADDSFGLLVSLYAGFISEHCTRYLQPGGFLLVNPSHGDAAMASLDERYRLRGVVVDGTDGFSVDTDALDEYLVPKRDVDVTRQLLHETGRGVDYTRSPFAYLFGRIA